MSQLGDSRHGRLFWSSLVVGWAAIGFGVLSLLSHHGATRPGGFALYVVGLLIAHDLLLAPVVCAFAAFAGRRLPGRVRGPFLGAAVVSGILILTAYPLVRGFGRLVDNPSLLPRDYAAGLLVVLAVVWAGALALSLATGRRIRAGRGEA